MHQILNGGNEEDALRNIFQAHDGSSTVTKSGAVYEVTYMGKSFLLGSSLEYIERVDANVDEWTFNNSTQTLTAYKGDLTTKRGNQEIGEVIIPNYYNGKRVKTIGNSLFYNNKSITSLTISDGIETIEGNAFSECSNLRGDLIIPNSITSIGGWAFNNCSSLDGELKLGKSLQTIGNSAFRECTNLRGNLIIPNSVVSIGPHAFWKCSSLNGEIKLGKSLQTIGDSAFSECTNLRGDLIIPNSITNIERYAFNNCENLSGNIIIPDCVISIEPATFRNCILFESITFLNKQTTINSVPPNAVIKGYAGSTAQQYANDNGKTFVTISE